MKFILIYLGLCAIYYPLLIFWDRKKKKAFQLEKKKAIGKLDTPPLEASEIPTTDVVNLFGATTATLEKVRTLKKEQPLSLEANGIIDEDMDQLLLEIEEPSTDSSTSMHQKLQETTPINDLNEEEIDDLIDRTISLH